MDAQQPRQANRVRLHASDYYFLVLMGVCAASVIMNWSDYDRCQDPMHVRANWCTLLLMYTLCAQHPQWCVSACCCQWSVLKQVWLLADYATLFVFRLLALQNQYLANSRKYVPRLSPPAMPRIMGTRACVPACCNCCCYVLLTLKLALCFVLWTLVVSVFV